MVLASALMCLALNIYFEARGEPVLGQYAVAAVTMNRAGDDQQKVCAVVTEPHQFSWTTTRIAHTKSGWRLKASGVPTDTFAWMIATKIAYNVLKGNKIDMTHGATFYHSNAVSPAWRRAVEQSASIGNHIFYRSE